jgi:hypothetical protein
MDLGECQSKAERKIMEMGREKTLAILDAEKQKNTVLQYIDYVKEQSSQIMDTMEEAQVLAI